MRDLFLLFVFLIIAIQTFRTPQAGILGWTWLTLMTPNKLTWGFAYFFPFNLVLAIVTLLVMLVSTERKLPRWNALTVVWALFILDITVTSLFSLAPDITWDRWNRAVKIMALGLCVPMVMTSKERIHALILVMVVSIGYFGIRGGGFTLLTGGIYHVLGPADSGLGDNNYLALALCLTLPLLNYVRLQSMARVSRIAATIAIVLVTIAILGTYSRGGLVGLGIVGIYFIWKSRRRVAITCLIVLAGVAALQFMPSSWIGRMSTIETAQQLTSFQERLDAWNVALNTAAARPLTGSGLGAGERSDVYTWFHGERAFGADATLPTTSARAYHSIYFQVLGDNGWPGLFLFLALLALTWRYLGQIRRAARGVPGLSWAFDLATMMQISLASYAVAGAALSMAYYDMPYLFMGIAVAMREIVRNAGTETTRARLPTPGFPAGHSSEYANIGIEGPIGKFN